MTVLEATVEIAKAALSNNGGSIQALTDEKVRHNFVKGITDIFKTLEGLVPKTDGRQQ
jgi:hypothetical protein